MDTIARSSCAATATLARRTPLVTRGGCLLLVLMLLCALVAAQPAQAAEQVGYRAQPFAEFNAGSGGAPTGEKPESKLWYHDGAWWAAMVSPAAGGAHTIHQLRGTTWTDTGTLIDESPSSKEDVLSLGDTLYIVSRGPWKLRRYSYTGSSYQLDAGFPVSVPVPGAEALTLARDTTGTLWLAWERDGRISVARSQGADTAWGSPYVLPVDGADNTTSDDIAAVIAFQDNIGPAIGVMWSNQNTDTQYFAVHRDGDPDGAWAGEVALSGPSEADDHINLKTAFQHVFGVVKTSKSGSGDPLIRLLERSPDGQWSSHPVALYVTGKQNRNTRPIAMLEIDVQRQDIYVFMTQGEGPSARGIVYKKSSFPNIGFPRDATWFIRGPSEEEIDDSTSMKANATAESGIVVMAADAAGYYWWNKIGGADLPSPVNGAPTAEVVATPTEGSAPLSVAFDGSGSSDPDAGDTLAYAWDLDGDGAFDDAEGVTASYTYEQAGTYVASVRVTDSAGGTDTASVTITVSESGGGGDPGGETGVFVAVADSYVSEGSTRNYGTSSSLRVRQASSDFRSYLKFEVTGVSGPAEATLRVYVTDPSNDGGTVYRTATGWDELGIDWFDAPPPDATPLGGVGSVGTTGVWVDVALGQVIDGPGTYAFVIADGSSNSVLYASRETDTPPQLLVR